jgi:hypothetical protein
MVLEEGDHGGAWHNMWLGGEAWWWRPCWGVRGALSLLCAPWQARCVSLYSTERGDLRIRSIRAMALIVSVEIRAISVGSGLLSLVR